MSLAAPLGLLLGALAVPLVALYFLKLRRRRVKVPSVLLWQAFEKSERLATPFQRFRRNPLLWLQLLALALLALALARPFLETDAPLGRSLVLVVDASASMGATDASPTRLAAAVAQAREMVDRMGATDEAMVVVAGATTEVRVPFTRDRAKLAAALGQITVTEAEGGLRDGLQLALSMAATRPGVEVAVLSDGGGGDLADLPVGGASVHFLPVGRSARNAAILAVDLRRSPASDLARQLFVTVQAFGVDPIEAAVEIYVDDALVTLRTETLAPDVPTPLVFDLPADLAGVLRVRLDARDDLLPADDQAWLVVSRLSLRRVLLVGGDGLTARALAADPRVRLTRVSADAFAPSMLDDVDVTLFASGTVPPDLDGRRYGVLGPLPGSPVRFGEVARGPRVLGWVRTHPVARFVSWDDVIVARTRTVASAGGLVPIVDSDAGPLVLAGEVAGGRALQLAFDPLETDLPLRVAWPVTLLNAVGWLSEGAAGSEGAQMVPTGSPWTWRLPPGASPDQVRVLGPDGARVDAVVVDGLLRVRDTSRVGVYRVRGGGVNTAFAANLLSTRESDIGPRPRLDLADQPVATSQASMTGRREVWRVVALIALGLLLVEWLAYHRRRVA